MITTPAGLGHAPTHRKIATPGPEWLRFPVVGEAAGRTQIEAGAELED